ncbi:MAG: hypothetical protein QRY72_02435 [Candidatus Rhabdochlamydia sp.]
MSYFKAILFTPLTVMAFEQEPWPSNLFEWKLTPSHGLSQYSKLNKGPPQTAAIKNELTAFHLLFTPLPELQTDVEFQCAKSALYPMGYQSSAVQLRYQLLDDLTGDSCALTAALLLRTVDSKWLHDVSCPYAAPLELEFSTFVGKELDDVFFQRVKLFTGIQLGLGNQGAPWIHHVMNFETLLTLHQQLNCSLYSRVGLGNQIQIDPDDFEGYGFIKYRNIDVRFTYRYLIPIWGSLAIQYGKRVYARSCPQNLDFWQISYTFPFSLF